MAASEKQKEYLKRHYRKNPQYYKDKAKKRVDELREWTRKQKNAPCTDCGESYPPYVMDFDHRDPSQKSFNLGTGALVYSRAKVEAEIAKCDLVCSNCHRERTYQRHQGITI
jgi:hypothetical protein